MSIGEKKSFWELISDKKMNSITIPQIQRDYVQGRSDDKVTYSRETLLDDMKKSIINNEPLDLNFVYGIENNSIFVPIDGQQRLTTLLVLHIYAFSKDNLLGDLKLLSNKFNYKTRISTGRFILCLIDNLKKYFSERKYEKISDFITDSEWYSQQWERDPSVKSFIIVLDDIHARFSDVNNLSAILKSDSCPLFFMSLKMNDVGKTNDLYIKMNSRGKPLTEFENFKSFLYDYLETVKYDEIDDFKKKLENQWVSFIWELVDSPEKNCDIRMMKLLDLIIKNRLNSNDSYKAGSKKELFEKLNASTFYNFSLYEKLVDKVVIEDIHKTFNFILNYCDYINNPTPNIPKWLNKLLNEEFNPGHQEKARLALVTKYAVSVDENSWNVDLFNDWYRIGNNLIKNTPIDVELRAIDALKSIYSIESRYCNDPIGSFANYISGIAFFDDKQLKEEKLKCQLIIGNGNWKDAIISAENNLYFKSEINFALKLCDVFDASNNNLTITKIDDFKSNLKIINYIFDEYADDHLRVGGDLFRSALITFGDYKIAVNQDTYTYCFETKKRYYDWRRMLRENTSFGIFKLLFHDLKTSHISSSKDVSDKLKTYIDNYTNVTNELLYYLVKCPAALNWMKEKKYKIDTINNRTLLLSGSTLQGQYAEYKTYFVMLNSQKNIEYKYGQGNLDSPDSKAYISSISGAQCHIEFDNNTGCFYDENHNPYLDANGNRITSVECMKNYIDSHY